MAHLFDGILDWSCRDRAGPRAEFPALDNFAFGGLDLEKNPARSSRNPQGLSGGNSGGTPQITGKNNPIGLVQFYGCCHAITMARLWHGCKSEIAKKESNHNTVRKRSLRVLGNTIVWLKRRHVHIGPSHFPSQPFLSGPYPSMPSVVGNFPSALSYLFTTVKFPFGPAETEP